ncbi:FHA domain-containing protein [Chloroflexota bacterium]
METYTEEVALLVAQNGPLNGERWALRKMMIIGRDESCDIVISDRQVSRQHARISVTSEGIFLEDLKSKNGIHLNGAPVAEKVLLRDSDMIQIAVAQEFVFLSSDSTVPLEDSDLSLQAIRRTETQAKKPVIRQLSLDKRSRRVWVHNKAGDGLHHQKEVLPPLSISQFRLLELLYDNPGKVVSRQECVVTIWGEEQAFDVSEQALDALVRRLRDRIAGADPSHKYVITVRGHGLRLDNPELPDQ